MNHNVTFNCPDYKGVLEISKQLESMGGKITSVNVSPDVFDDKTTISANRAYKQRQAYTLVSEVPMSVAIRYC